ncbi:GlcG/HbpS family heme-binding protein [Pseudacidovorax sp. NFM-22]|uniref:GlcG/HbpS family heme-binding protein n=1 Tax=Pseudacidovorax sp. NFM-22 TaxID=2744469 RepID=UPI001F1FBCDB|nr:heme-binding protein [Pseudacidovorax sp. NFM-22]
MTASLTLDQAQRLLAAALARSRERGFKPMAVAVLDGAGHLKAFAGEDGASMFRFDVARAKAWGAVGMGVASRALAERARDNPNFFVSLSATAQGRFLPQTGAVVIKDASGTVIGAVGASGGTGDEDELICIAGVEAVGLQWG